MQKSDFCESFPGNRKPKTSHPKNNNDRTSGHICGQLLLLISLKASKTFVAFTWKGNTSTFYKFIVYLI